MLAWVFDRCNDAAAARDTAIGRVPEPGALPTDGLQLAPGALDELLSVDADAWRAELPLIEEHYEQFGDRCPQALHDELDVLAKRSPTGRLGNR